MRILHICAALALAVAAVPAAAAALNSQDASYLQTAIQIANARYAFASYEKQHGTGSAKALAASIESQSTQDSRMLSSLAQKEGVTPKKGLMMQDNYNYGQLQGLSGSQLDQAFARVMKITDNVNKYTYKDELKHGQNPALKAYAKKRYDAVQHELTQLKA